MCSLYNVLFILFFFASASSAALYARFLSGLVVRIETKNVIHKQTNKNKQKQLNILYKQTSKYTKNKITNHN